MPKDEKISKLGWWTLSGEALMELLERAYDGERPDLIYAEEYANSRVEKVEGNDGD